MSVLYKALARAAKAHEARHGDAPAAPQPSAPLGRRPKESNRLRVVLLVAGGVLALGVGTLVLFGDDILSWVDQPQTDVSSRPRPRPIAPSLPKLPTVPQVATAVPSPTSPAQAVAPAAVVPSAEPGQPAAPPSQPAVAPPVAPVAADNPPAAATPVTAGSDPTVPQPAPPLMPPAVPQVAPVARRAAEDRPRPARAVQPDEDLPAILDRIRRQKESASLGERVTVSRNTATADLTGAEGETAISVSVTKPTEREDAKSAYDLLLHGQYEGALDLYRRALKGAPDSVPLLLGKATAEQKLRHYYDARVTYRRVLSLDPENREALANMTAMVADQSPAEALSELRNLQRAYPAFSPIAAQLASIEAARGDTSAAIAALGEAVSLSPDNGLYRLNLAILQDRAGMVTEAAASYAKAIELIGSETSLPIPLEQIRQRLSYLQGR